jgi:deoxyribodipyrimidine photolyase-like uncharacterized protein
MDNPPSKKVKDKFHGKKSKTTVGVWILGAQLWQNQAALNRTDDKSSLPVILIESWQHVQQRRYHRQKLVLIWSAVHFAEELRGGAAKSLTQHRRTLKHLSKLGYKLPISPKCG